jgi:Ca2+-transporting ATPase
MRKKMEKQTKQWHVLTTTDTLNSFSVQPASGLDEEQVKTRMEQYGPNSLAKGKKRSVSATFFAQFADVMIWVLLAAAVISVLLKEIPDAVIILIVVILNAVLGTVQ